MIADRKNANRERRWLQLETSACACTIKRMVFAMCETVGSILVARIEVLTAGALNNVHLVLFQAPTAQGYGWSSHLKPEISQ